MQDEIEAYREVCELYAVARGEMVSLENRLVELRSECNDLYTKVQIAERQVLSAILKENEDG